jgi:uncharacterized protein YfeS
LVRLPKSLEVNMTKEKIKDIFREGYYAGASDYGGPSGFDDEEDMENAFENFLESYKGNVE